MAAFSYSRAAPMRTNIYGALLGVALAAGTGWAMALVRPGVNEFLLCAIGALLLIPLLQRWVTGSFDLFEPLMAFLAIYGLLFFARPIATLIEEEFVVFGYDIEQAIPSLLTVALIGLACFHLGYFLSWGERLGRRLPPLPSELRPRPMLVYALALIGAGLLLLATFIYSSGGVSALQELMRGRTEVNAQFFEASNQYISQGVYLLIPASLIVLITGVSKNRRAMILFALAVMLVIVMVSFPLGARRWLLILVGSAFTLMYLRTDTRPRLLPLIVVSLVVFFGGITFVRDARVAWFRESAGLTSIATESFTDPTYGLRRVVLGPDTMPAVALAVELTAVPDAVGYRYGTALLPDLAFSPIPRNLWPGKPLTAIDELRASLWGEPCNAAPGGTCLDLTLLGDFYLDLGIPGVAGGMFLLGLALRALYSYYRANRDNPAVLLVYAATLPFIVLYVRAGLVPVAGWAGIIIGPLLLGVLLAGRTTNHRYGHGEAKEVRLE